MRKDPIKATVIRVIDNLYDKVQDAGTCSPGAHKTVSELQMESVKDVCSNQPSLTLIRHWMTIEVESASKAGLYEPPDFQMTIL